MDPAGAWLPVPAFRLPVGVQLRGVMSSYSVESRDSISCGAWSPAALTRVPMIVGFVVMFGSGLPAATLVTTPLGGTTVPGSPGPQAQQAEASVVRVAQNGPNLIESLFPFLKPKPKPVIIVPQAPPAAIVVPAKPAVLPATRGVILRTTRVPGSKRVTVTSLARGAAYDSQESPYASPDAQNDRSVPATGLGAYRTVCVRLCDGYYWPVSNSASMSQVRRDADTCEQSCSTPAKLFYQTDGGADPIRMRDLEGNAYRKLKTAFRYRKQFSPECRCHPDPWAESERIRHEEYAMEARFKDLQAADGQSQSASIQFEPENYDLPATGESMAPDAAAAAPEAQSGASSDPQDANGDAGPMAAGAAGLPAATPKAGAITVIQGAVVPQTPIPSAPATGPGFVQAPAVPVDPQTQPGPPKLWFFNLGGSPSKPVNLGGQGGISHR